MRIQIVVVSLIVVALSFSKALADKRVALVIGNSAYETVTALVNPANDANAMAATFKAAGFDVVDLKRDLKVNDMRRVLRDFSDSARDADIAIVYYAGHGMEIEGTNYIIPTDAVLKRDIDAFDEAIPLDRLLTVIEPARQLRLVILDACRDNPFNKNMARTIGSRAISRGLARVEPASANTLIAFAAKAGSTASDGDLKNSPFTSALIKYLPKPGLDLRKALGFTRDDVLKATNNKQEPFTYGSLGGDDIALVPGAVVTPPAGGSTAPAVSDDSNARRDYELAERVGTKEAWDFFIATYPNGFYAKLALAQRNKTAAEEARIAATEKAKTAQDEQTRLAIESTKAAEQTKAAAQARTDQARIAAEIAKRDEETKVIAQAKAAEDARVAALRVAPAPPRTLLNEMGPRSQWAIGGPANCNISRTAYTFELSAGSITWRSGIGSVDIESVVSNSENSFDTTTRTSVHTGGGNERAGQSWNYTRDGNRIRVQPGGRNAFSLVRCQ